MYDYKNGIHTCDFCQKELNKIYYIYPNRILGDRNECCFKCQQRRKHEGEIIKKDNLFFWR